MRAPHHGQTDPCRASRAAMAGSSMAPLVRASSVRSSSSRANRPADPASDATLELQQSHRNRPAVAGRADDQIGVGDRVVEKDLVEFDVPVSCWIGRMVITQLVERTSRKLSPAWRLESLHGAAARTPTATWRQRRPIFCPLITQRPSSVLRESGYAKPGSEPAPGSTIMPPTVR